MMTVIALLVANMMVGAGVCAKLDTEDQVFYRWLKKATHWSFPFVVLELWSIMAYFMIKYKRERDEDILA